MPDWQQSRGRRRRIAFSLLISFLDPPIRWSEPRLPLLPIPPDLQCHFHDLGFQCLLSPSPAVVKLLFLKSQEPEQWKRENRGVQNNSCQLHRGKHELLITQLSDGQQYGQDSKGTGYREAHRRTESMSHLMVFLPTLNWFTLADRLL